MTIATMEIAIRLLVIGQELLIAIVLLTGKAPISVRVSGATLALGVAGYLFASDPFLRHSAPLLLPLATLLAIAVPYCLWAFARAIFEAPWPNVSITAAVIAMVIVAWGIVTADAYVPAKWADFAGDSVRLLSLAVVAHTLWLAWAGRPDDLVAPRRSFRVLFVAVIGAQVIVVLVVELIFETAIVPAWLDLLNVVMIGLLTLGFAVPLLSLNREYFASGPIEGPPGAIADRPALRPVDAVLRERLLELMASGYYRETGLTIRRLAERLGYPEHQVRRVINGHLGYRNFSAFVNRYRIDEAKRHLSDPGKARIPILTIALDLGFASIGPFNRSFKEQTGKTPSAYRRRELGGDFADSE